MALIFWLV